MSHPPVARKRWVFNRVQGLCLVVTCGAVLWHDCLCAKEGSSLEVHGVIFPWCFGFSAKRYVGESRPRANWERDWPYSAFRDEVYPEYEADLKRYLSASGSKPLSEAEARLYYKSVARVDYKYWDSLVVSGTVLRVVLWLSLLGTAFVVVARPRFSSVVMVAACAASIASMQVFLHLTRQQPWFGLSSVLLPGLAVVVWSGICLVPAIAWLVRFLNRIEANKLARR